MKLIDLSGLVFGRLMVIKKVTPIKKRTMWLCRCVCGNEKIISASNISNGITSSCGCISLELLAIRNTKHKLSNSTTYKTWLSMKSRCKKRYSYSDGLDYVAKGIKVCERWSNSFKFFLEDMGIRPEGTSIDRINPNGDYTPDNCRWATIEQQANNKNSNLFITHNGIKKTYAQWSRILNGSNNIVSQRINNGWTEEKAINTTVRKREIKVKSTGKRDTCNIFAVS